MSKLSNAIELHNETALDEECAREITEANIIRAKIEHERAYKQAYAEKYAQLVVDPEYAVWEAEESAKQHAKDFANQVEEDFWEGIR